MVYDFSATWCGPCQQVAPVVSKLSREGLPIQKIDIDQHKSMADQFHIDSVPTFVLVVDGKEVTRQSGYMSENDLRRMIARIPKEPRAAPGRIRNASEANGSGMEFPVELGSPGSIPRPDSTPMVETEVADEEPSRSGLGRLWPFGRRDQEEPTVRGNNGSASADPLSNGQMGDPMNATVRIRVVINNQVNVGTGTIISSAPGISRILTCAHILKDFNEDAKIEVELLYGDQPQMYIARLIKTNEKADLGLISIPTDNQQPSIPVPDVNGLPKIGAPVACIGCSGGELPTRKQLRVTGIDLYDPPNNIECTGVPVEGRSGGGLFNAKGEIVGVCIGANDKKQRGLYSGLLAVHMVLDQCGLTELYRRTAPPADGTILANGEHEPSTRPFPNSPSGQLPPSPVSTALNEQPVLPSRSQPSEAGNAAMDVQSGDAEVVVIIRDKSRPNVPNRVVIIHNASPKFMGYLDGELAPKAPAQPITRHDRPYPTGTPVVRNINTDKYQFRQTAKAQPVIPRRYVRPVK